MYTPLSILFICVEVGLLALLVYLIFFKKDIVNKKCLAFAVPVFVVVYALYTMGSIYNADNGGEKYDFYAAFNLIKKTLSLFAFEVSAGVVRPLGAVNGWYAVATAIACALTVLTSVFSVVVLFGVKVSNALRKAKRFMSGCDIVFGVSPSSMEYLKRHKNAVLWVEKIKRDEYQRLLKEGYTVHRAPLNEKNMDKCLRGAEYHLIVFRDVSNSYFSILSCFEKLKPNADKHLFLHLEANANEVQVVREKYVSAMPQNTNSFIMPFCRYELMARRFITDHPITRYIPRDFFHENLTLKDDKQINVVFLGFGKVNYELFKMMVTNFQFAKQENGKLKVAPVRYYTFEREKERFNNEYFIRLRDEYDELFQNSSLPPAERVCDLQPPMQTDVHSLEARREIRALVHENSYTYFIVSAVDDFQDAGLAYGLKDLLDGESNYKIFVRSKGADSRLLGDEREEIVYFGENATCFTHENIVNDDLMQLSRHVNDLYNDYTQDEWAQLRVWQKLPTVEQYSNVNAATHIHYKLNLMGFALQKTAGVGVTKEEFERVYPDAFMRENGNEYSYFFGLTTANVLAFIEHSRWNAYYLLSGYKPLPFDEFVWARNDKGKDVLKHKDTDRRRHACLTTYEGLDELISYKYQTMQEAVQKGEKEVGAISRESLADLYRYDYMVIDGMYDALTGLGYSIVKR